MGVGKVFQYGDVGGEQLCGAMGYAAHVQHDGGVVGGGLVGVVDFVGKGVEVVLYAFEHQLASATVEVGELPAVVDAVGVVEGLDDFVGKGLPLFYLSKEIGLAETEVEAVGEEPDGLVDDEDGTVGGYDRRGVGGLAYVVVETGDVKVYVVGHGLLPFGKGLPLKGEVVVVEGVVKSVGPGLCHGGGHKGQQQREDGVPFHCNECFMAGRCLLFWGLFHAAKIHNIFLFSTFFYSNYRYLRINGGGNGSRQ